MSSIINVHRVHGFSLLEVLITMIILAVGLLGLVGLQGKALTSQMESYQRSQALVLVQDMASRIEANGANAANYVTSASPRGTGYNSSAVMNCATAATRAALDLCEWHNLLLGAAEKNGTQTVGAMVGARGCIYQISAATPQQYVVSVAWQGLSATTVPSSDCGSGNYGTDDALRRVISIPITLGYIG